MTLPDLIALLEGVLVVEFPSKEAYRLTVALCREFRNPTPDGCEARAAAVPVAVVPPARKARRAYRTNPKKEKVT